MLKGDSGNPAAYQEINDSESKDCPAEGISRISSNFKDFVKWTWQITTCMSLQIDGEHFSPRKRAFWKHFRKVVFVVSVISKQHQKTTFPIFVVSVISSVQSST